MSNNYLLDKYPKMKQENKKLDADKNEKVILSPFLVWIYCAITHWCTINRNCVSISDATHFN